ncbi:MULTISPECIES: NTP transferase domain-containing protein [unclassified Meiothermus]|uniref:nucleotidyltransferase family protein n=1 Tax=unclassified Meiothermus TaxID=370471 RepID=UPI000D7C2D29|nr:MULTISPECIES: nucleotidyltransferase family protein [unclassified Meiothermus]PZA07313.1 nucleotidyltransferase family protein [Meiothermus sp. Pnk-1]RYM37306.1 nucleotidyltransferase family protein [Meiothermus sp. PNK-Is4]
MSKSRGPVVAVVLAAGESRRMGQNKMLLPLGQESVVRRAVRQVLEAGFDAVWAVVGRDAAQVKAELEGLPVFAVENPRYPQGLGSSFRAAVQALPEGVEAAMFTLADQVFLSAGLYREVLEAYRASRPKLVVCRYGEVLAPPHLFQRELFPELGQEPGQGGKEVLRRYAAEAVTLAMPEAALFDLDTPDDYQEALRRLADSGM